MLALFLFSQLALIARVHFRNLVLGTVDYGVFSGVAILNGIEKIIPVLLTEQFLDSPLLHYGVVKFFRQLDCLQHTLASELAEIRGHYFSLLGRIYSYVQ